MALDPGYLGNVNLKRVGEKIEYTPEMIQEYIKCSKDPIYFAKKYIKIVHVDRGIIPLDLYPYQEEIVNKFNANRRLVVATSRQVGKTTTAMLLIVHYMIFNQAKTVAILANKGAAAQEVMSRIQLAYESLPKWLQQGVVTWNKQSIELENRCIVFSAATSSSSIRGKTCNLIYIDETAFVENWDEFFQSTYPAISSGVTTKLLLTSTPNGLNHFWKTHKGAVEGKNGYAHVEVMWYDVPGRDEAWRQETLQALDGDEEKFAQEYCIEFQGSSGTLVNGEALKRLSSSTPIQHADSIRQYELPVKDHVYVITVDVSRGKGLDYSAFSVFDCTTMPYKQVCIFRDNQVSPGDYAAIIFRIAQLYNFAYVMVEINDTGGQVVDSLYMDFGYEQIIMTEHFGRQGKRISSGFSGKKTERGIRTTKVTKAIGCSLTKLLIEQQQLIIPDAQTIEELKRFSRKGTSYQAEPGSHDDTVMTIVLFAWMTNQPYFKELTDINTLEQLRDKTERQIEDELLPFGFIDTGSNDNGDVTIELVDWGVYDTSFGRF